MSEPHKTRPTDATAAEVIEIPEEAKFDPYYTGYIRLPEEILRNKLFPDLGFSVGNFKGDLNATHFQVVKCPKCGGEGNLGVMQMIIELQMIIECFFCSGDKYLGLDIATFQGEGI
jgi:hypothetical protein